MKNDDEIRVPVIVVYGVVDKIKSVKGSVYIKKSDYDGSLAMYDSENEAVDACAAINKCCPNANAEIRKMEYVPYDYFLSLLTQLEEAAERLNFLNAALFTRSWVDVSERLPPDDGRYLVRYKSDSNSVFSNNQSAADMSDFSRSIWPYFTIERVYKKKVTHWMTIPELEISIPDKSKLN